MMTQPIGLRLRQAREDQEISLEKIARETHIRLHYLRALEDGDLEALPSAAQARGFLRSYARYLGLDLKHLPADLSDEVVREPFTPEPSPVLPGSTDLSPADIYASLGKVLKDQRELLGFSLDDIEQNTHIRAHYLLALEGGQIGELPSPVQGRGMLANYANFLGLESEPLLLQFAEGLQADLAARQGGRKTVPGSEAGRIQSPGWRWLLSGDVIIGGVLILALVGFVLWGAIRISTLRAEQTGAEAPLSIGQVLNTTSTPTLLPTTPTPEGNASLSEVEEPPEVFEETALPEFGEGIIQVYVVVKQRSWMRVVVDGEEVFSGRTLPGSAYPFSGDERIEILTGNAAGLQVYHNQIDLGTLGFYGEVVNLLFTADGAITPTPTLTPTVTPTTPTTPTAVPTATPEAS